MSGIDGLGSGMFCRYSRCLGRAYEATNVFDRAKSQQSNI